VCWTSGASAVHKQATWSQVWTQLDSAGNRGYSCGICDGGGKVVDVRTHVARCAPVHAYSALVGRRRVDLLAAKVRQADCIVLGRGQELVPVFIRSCSVVPVLLIIPQLCLPYSLFRRFAWSSFEIVSRSLDTHTQVPKIVVVGCSAMHVSLLIMQFFTVRTWHGSICSFIRDVV
jgi:hypothetical protein